MSDGWIKLHRKILDSQVFACPNLFHTWAVCLLLANHEEKWLKISGLAEPIKIEPGQFLTGRYEFHKICYPKKRRSNPHPITLWKWLLTLQDMQNLNIKSNNKFSIITVINWGFYQSREHENAQQNAPQALSRRSADAQQTHTNKNDKNVKNEKNYKNNNLAPSSNGDSEPEETASPVLVFPTVGNVHTWNLYQPKIDEYQQTYPGVNVVAECRLARQWCIDNPSKRKTVRGIAAFLNSWLSRAQDKPHPTGLFQQTQAQTTESLPELTERIKREAAKG